MGHLFKIGLIKVWNSHFQTFCKKFQSISSWRHLPFAILWIVDFEIPVMKATSWKDKSLSFIISFSRIFIIDTLYNKIHGWITGKKCPKCGKDLRRSKQDSNYMLCDNCRKKYKLTNNHSNEYHIIINFTLNTTSNITVIGNLLDVTTYDYVDQEEHDAKLACSGTLLSEYHVNIDTGEIEKIQ